MQTLSGSRTAASGTTADGSSNSVIVVGIASGSAGLRGIALGSDTDVAASGSVAGDGTAASTGGGTGSVGSTNGSTVPDSVGETTNVSAADISGYSTPTGYPEDDDD